MKNKAPHKPYSPATQRVRRQKNYLGKPTFDLEEKHFLVQRENFLTGLWRAIRMFVEYMRGFYAFSKVKNCITIFGSARFQPQDAYYKMARTLGKKLAQDGFSVMTGGGPGIMEAANRGAKEGGGVSVGCNINLPDFPPEAHNLYVDRRITLKYFFVRKVMLTKYSLAFIFMPGGFGTLDELFEMATLVQTKKLYNFPLVLMGTTFWQPLIEFMQNTLLKQGTIVAEDVASLLLTDSVDEALQFVRSSLKKVAEAGV